MTAMPEPFYDDPNANDEGLPDGTMLLNEEFQITGRLSHGGFGITYLAKDNSLSRTVVIKECFPEAFCSRRNNTSVMVRSSSHEDQYRSIVKMFMREARSIAKMRHPNIVGVHRVFEDNHTAYMALDLIDGHDLQEIIEDEDRDLTPTQVKDILFKILDAIELVHAHDLLHRDISPDNILLDKWGNPVLIDFGAAREEASKKTRTISTVMVVKDGYSPQEFYFAGSQQNASSDLYALAATFYHLISGEAPAHSQSRVSEIAMKNPDPCVPLAGSFPEYDDAFLEAIDMAMRISPQDRIQSAREWVQMIDPNNTHVENYVRPVVNEGLGMTLTSLVSETNQELLTIPPTPLKMTPLETLQANTDKDVADWVKEFNEETAEKTRVARTEDGVASKMSSRFRSPDKIPLEVPKSSAEDAELFGEEPKKKFSLKPTIAVVVLLAGCYAVLTNPAPVLAFLGP
jgi:serine/threonine protein kinase